MEFSWKDPEPDTSTVVVKNELHQNFKVAEDLTELGQHSDIALSD
jgi:hypothetical protein